MPLLPLSRFGRFVTSVTRNCTVTILPGDTISVALVEKTIMGHLQDQGSQGAGRYGDD